MILAFVVGSDDQLVKPPGKAPVLGQRRTEGLRILLPPVEDQPAARQVVAVYIIYIAAFERGRDIALIEVARIIRILPLFPLVFGVELLRDIPLAHRRVQRVEEHAGATRLKRYLATAFDGT